MAKEEWSEAQLLEYVREQGEKGITVRKLKRFRQEGVLSTPRVTHLGFGPGTTSIYTAEDGSQVVAVCRLLKYRRNYDVVRFHLWLEGYPIETGLLKESLWRLVPFHEIADPDTIRQRKYMAKQLASQVLKQTWNSVRSNMLRKVLQQFGDYEEQEWFLHLQMQLLYGLPIDFERTYINCHADEVHIALQQTRMFEEPADIIAHGLQTQHIRFIQQGEDIAHALQLFSDEKLLSLSRFHKALFTAREDDLELALSRLDVVSQMFEALDILGYLKGPLRWYNKVLDDPIMRALMFIMLLVLEQGGYGSNIVLLQKTLQVNLPIMKRGRLMYETLRQELPQFGEIFPPFPKISRFFVEGSEQEHNAHIAHLQRVYQQNKELFDAFMQRHPEFAVPDKLYPSQNHREEEVRRP